MPILPLLLFLVLLLLFHRRFPTPICHLLLQPLTSHRGLATILLYLRFLPPSPACLTSQRFYWTESLTALRPPYTLGHRPHPALPACHAVDQAATPSAPFPPSKVPRTSTARNWLDPRQQRQVSAETEGSLQRQLLPAPIEKEWHLFPLPFLLKGKGTHCVVLFFFFLRFYLFLERGVIW